MQRSIVYLKCDRSVVVNDADVFLRDLAKVYCADKEVMNSLQKVKIYHFNGKQEDSVVIDTVSIVESIEQHCVDIEVQVIGETDVLVERKVRSDRPAILSNMMIGFVCLICFFGTAFTIMAYHNDVGINGVFRTVYLIVTGKEAAGITGMEIAYSFGLAAGILLFFNHFGNKKITGDLTPIEVSMRKYEEDADRAMIEMAGRNGEEK